MDGDFTGVFESRHHPAQSVAALGFTEFAFNCVPFACFRPFLPLLLVVQLLVLRWSAQIWSVHSDAHSRTILVVLAVPIDLVGQNPFRITAMPFSETFDGGLQIARFIESIPVQLFDHGVTVDQAD